LSPVTPLSLFEISPHERLMVITCHYEMTGAAETRFAVAPDSVEFHLFEEIVSAAHDSG
jgi:hypothetical protein